MKFQINKNTTVHSELNMVSVNQAIDAFKRDINHTCCDTNAAGIAVTLIETDIESEAFYLKMNMEDETLELHAFDDLGFIYGLYEISRSILGVTNFWFWNDQVFHKQDGYLIAEDFYYASTPFRVRFRGWFVNDEVLIHTWRINGNKEEVWKMVFEALLRCGGNMVIPGTDKNAFIYHHLASDMGLYITHHHAEPLGAVMFLRAYPELNPSFDEHPKKFIDLWKEAIEKQKDEKIVWNLGFRGQGDCPFWVNDPRYDSKSSRGKLIEKLICMQYDMVKEVIPNAVCCSNLYGETMELYKGGYLTLPDDIIKIWADNGYGKMVSRRQENHNPRIPALPDNNDTCQHGIYYHVSFYDLQAANHMTMMPNSPLFIKSELMNVLEAGCEDYWIINCSNVKPHVYFLDFIANLWRDGDISIDSHRNKYIEQYFGSAHQDMIFDCFTHYFNCSTRYGQHEDDHAGEQFTNHVPRILISDYMKGNPKSDQLIWAIDAIDLQEQLNWYEKICHHAKENYQLYLEKCEATAATLSDEAAILFKDSLCLQAKIHDSCSTGAHLVCLSLKSALAKDYQQAFYLAGKARLEYLSGNQAMRSREHDKWTNFYENECLTDMKQTAWVLEGLMAYLRNMGDGPHYYLWQREFLYSKEDRKVVLICNMENHLTDLELFELMLKK